MLNKRLPWISILLVMYDCIIIAFSYRIAFYAKFGSNIPDWNWDAYLKLIPVVFLITLATFYIFNLYSDPNKSIAGTLYSLLQAMTVVTILTMGYSYIGGVYAFPRSIALIAPIVEYVLFAILRLAFMLLSKRISGKRKILLVGISLLDSMRLKWTFSQHNAYKYSEFELATVGELPSKVDNTDIVALSTNIQDKTESVNLCMKKGKEVILAPDWMDIMVYSACTLYVDDKFMLAIKSPGLSISQQFVKRTFDLTISLLMLLIASPIMILIMILIPRLSPGPAIFTQERLGKDGHPFQVMKFRTMIVNAEMGTGPVLATDGDPRITKFGAFLRATRLDELPQIINVIMGNMSIVGPRPERKFFIDQFIESLPAYKYRMTVKPGMTGLAQVRGKYTTTPEEKLRFDLMYIRNYSFGLDLSILLQTVRVVLQKDKAAGCVVEADANVKKLVPDIGESHLPHDCTG